ncbi:PI-PLC domain-containing protein [Enterobacter cloacae]
MQILAHRGYWLKPEEKNSTEAILRAFQNGFGIETDIRDHQGELVICHDIPRREGYLTLASVLDDYVSARSTGVLAMNIKADGLCQEIQRQLKSRNISRYFCFDMSVPDTLPYLRSGVTVAARLSEYEAEGKLSRAAPALWVDGFHENYDVADHLEAWLNSGKSVCLVSPELHGRESASLWEPLMALPGSVVHHPGLMLCTDYPLQAQRIFNQ